MHLFIQGRVLKITRYNETLSDSKRKKRQQQKKDEEHSQYRVLNYVCVEFQGMRDGGGVRNEAQGLEG